MDTLGYVWMSEAKGVSQTAVCERCERELQQLVVESGHPSEKEAAFGA
jgi:hypothetical protein